MIKKILFFVGVLSIYILFIASSGGRAASAKAGNTGAPGDAEANGKPMVCANCHSGSAIEVDLALTLDDGEPRNYNPGTTYNLKVEINQTGGATPKGYGFQLISIKDSDNSPLEGSLSGGANNVQLSTIDNARTYAEHNGVSNSKTFEFDWTAPEKGTGTVTFYACGVGVDRNEHTSNDGANCIKYILDESTVGVNELFENISVDPNPAVDFINIPLENKFSYSIFDLNGNLLQSEENQERTISVKNLSSSLYFINIKSGDKTYVSKFIKR